MNEGFGGEHRGNTESGLTTHYYGSSNCGTANMAPKTPISGKNHGNGKPSQVMSTTASTAKNTQKSTSSKSYLEQYKERNKKSKNTAGASSSLSRLAASGKSSPPHLATASVSHYNQKSKVAAKLP